MHWNRPGAIAILAAFSLSAVVHVATYVGVNLPSAFPLLWSLHGVAILAFGAMIVSSRSGTQPNPLGLTIPEMPTWAYVLTAIAFVYAIVNFAVFFGLSEGGSPAIRDGIYVLSDHGRIIRTLTAEEYRWQEAYIVRGFSGHWMFFLLVPSLYFLFRDQPADSSSGTPRAASLD